MFDPLPPQTKLTTPFPQLQSKVVMMQEPPPVQHSSSRSSHKSSRHSKERRRSSPPGIPPPRLTPERYRGAYEQRSGAPDSAWSDPWMRGPSSPSKERKRHHSPSSSSSASSSEDSSPSRSISELKKTLDAVKKKRLVKKQAAKLKKLRDKLTPEEYISLVRGSKRSKKSSGIKKDDSSDSDSDSSTSRLL